MKRFIIIAILAICMVTATTVFAEDMELRKADPVFYSVTVTLQRNLLGQFNAGAYVAVDWIKVSSVSLQVKTGGSWGYYCSLTAPSTTSYGMTYYAEKDYSHLSLPSGTYRLQATFQTNNHSVTRYSNEITK